MYQRNEAAQHFFLFLPNYIHNSFSLAEVQGRMQSIIYAGNEEKKEMKERKRDQTRSERNENVSIA